MIKLSSLKCGLFAFCGINLSPITKGVKMYYLIKEETLNDYKPTFVTGGMGVDYRDPNNIKRYITNDIEKALVFDKIEDAEQYLCRGYVVAIQDRNGFKKV